MSFANQIALITGASSGIGHAVALQLAKKGCHLGLIARRKDKLDALATEVRALGVRAAVATANVGNREEIFAAIGQVRQELGPIDLLFANSGVGLGTNLEPINLDQIENIIRVNLMGTVYSICAVLPEMLQRGKGHLSAVSSLASYKGLPGESAYCASKAGINTYLEGLRIQLQDRGIAVTTICPGFIKTPMTDVNEFKMPFLMTADQAATRIVSALERRKKVFNFPFGTTFLMKLTRWLPDRMVMRFVGKHTDNRPQPSE